MAQLHFYIPNSVADKIKIKAERAHLLNNRHTKIEQHFRNLSPFEIALCSLPFDDICAEEYGLIRASLSSQVEIIRPNDLW